MSFDLSNYTTSFDIHRERPVIRIAFKRSKILQDQLRQMLPARWSATMRSWYVLDMPQYRRFFGLTTDRAPSVSLSYLSPPNQEAYHSMRQELILRSYSPNTRRTYLSEFYQFLLILRDIPASGLNTDRLRAYLAYCCEKLRLTEATLHSRINAIKFYYEQVLHQDQIMLHVPRPKKPKKLPKYLTTLEIKKILALTTNVKHRLALKLAYGMGLRVSEIVNLKLEHIDSRARRVHIVYAKGKKDRYLPLPETCFEDLKVYYHTYRPMIYLFEGIPSQPYTARSVQAVFKQAMDRAKIKKKIGIHGLRHSYATHLLEAGVDSMFIQQLLGHANLQTTMIYTHVADIKAQQITSPLDSLK